MREGFLVAKPVSILLLEDDDADAKAVMRAFRKAKIVNPVHRAVDGIEALDILRGKDGSAALSEPYIILADINMPRMSGLEFLQELRADARLKQAIVFMLTTSKRDTDRVTAYDLNVAGYIVKERAGEDFLSLAQMLSQYWEIVELPGSKGE